MSFFKAYDMRGTFGVDFSLETVYRVGRALPKVVGGTRWLVGRDFRLTSDAVQKALITGLVEAGAEVTDLGHCTTPMVYFFTAKEDFDGSVMVTASHNPPSDNGLKVSKKTALPVGYADGLNEVEKLVAADTATYDEGRPFPAVKSLTDALPRYIAWQKERVPNLEGLRFAVDCSNGAVSLLAKELFPNAALLNAVPDGNFPAHSPNPLKAEAREQIAAFVRENELDCGIIFDGDADRAMFVDEKGDFVQPDYLVPLLAKATAAAEVPEKPIRIIHDVRTSRGSIETLKELGFEPVMVPVGHAFAKPILRKVGALCGGELAGHYYFREFVGCDSGVLAAMRVLREIAEAKAKGLSFSELVAPISTRYANSGELNFKVADKDAAIARLLVFAEKALPQEISRETMDGLRVEYKEGWFNVRKSNTEPYLRLIVECDTAARLADWVARMRSVIEQ